ncbi:MAG: Bcr/CflA family efflux MFS transporter, partial [Alphaproteobacteria bacterium]
MTDAGSDKPDEPPRPPAIVPVLLIMVSSLSILSGDLYLPSMPLLQTVFSADAGQVQLTISLNLAGFALGMLVWGPASDRFGRRPMFVVALVLFALASLACAAAPSISTLIAARFLQGAAASAEVALGFAVIRDLYRDKDAVRLLALLGMVIAVVPMLGPVAGGYILAWFGWQANFILLAAGGGVAAVAIRLWLPESNPDRDRHALRPYVFLSTYARIWWNRQFVVMAGLSGLGFAMLMTFITVAPFYVIDVHGYAPETYGIY